MRKRTVSWAEKYFEMDYGLFDRTRHPPAEKILDTLDRRQGCKFLIVASAQSYKTLVVTIWVLASLVLRPRKTGWYSKGGKAVSEWAAEKFNPSFEACEPIQRLLPHDHNRITKLRKSLPHVQLQLLSAETQLDRQQKSLPYVVLDEWWTYESGWIKEIENRYTDYQESFRAIYPSTGGLAGSHAHDIWKESDQQTWHLKCPHCKELFNPEFFPPEPVRFAERKDDKGTEIDIKGERWWQPWGGLKYATDESVRQLDGTIDWPAFYRTVRYQCPLCGGETPYSAKTLREMDDAGEWIALNPDNCNRDVVAWCSNGLRHAKWTLLAEEWLKAVHAKNHGDTDPMEVFWKTRLAKFWDIRILIKNEHQGDARGEYLFGEIWAGGAINLMTIDVQQDHFWVVVRSWARDAESRLVWCGRVLSEGHLREIQLRYNVHDHGGRIAYDQKNRVHVLPAGCGVFLDGNYNPTYVRRLAATYHWCVLRGDDCPKFRHPDGKYRIFDVIRPIESFEGQLGGGSGDRYVAEIRFSNDDARNSLATLRGITEPRRIWTHSKDVEQRCPDYLKHLGAWIRVPKRRSKDNAYVFEWRKTSDSERDDLFWCEKGQVVGASMAGLIGAEAAGLESPSPEGDPSAG